ncbi:hypothetical protein [Pseudomonas sediminis]|nr:hypothetical protein [Pseudomonas sediminis]
MPPTIWISMALHCVVVTLPDVLQLVAAIAAPVLNRSDAWVI